MNKIKEELDKKINILEQQMQIYKEKENVIENDINNNKIDLEKKLDEKINTITEEKKEIIPSNIHEQSILILFRHLLNNISYLSNSTFIFNLF